MLSSVKVHLLDDVMRRDGELARRLGAIAKEWERVETALFTPYLKELGDYVRMVDPERRGAARPADRGRSADRRGGD